MINNNKDQINVINFRLAEIQDSGDLFKWRNDPQTRKNSIHTELISWDSHQNWFQLSLQNPNRKIYIASVDLQKIGMLRMDQKTEYTELSWCLDPAFRGKGFGRKMLLDFVSEQKKTFVARIRSNNIASIKIAESVGFRLNTQIDDILIFRMEVQGGTSC